MAGDTSDKIFDPTPRRRQQAREQGQVAQSQDLASAILLLVGVLLLMLLGKPVVEWLFDFAHRQWGEVGTLATSQQSVVEDTRLLLANLARVVLPFLVFVLLTGVMVGLLQTGFLFTPGRLAPDPARISMARGLQRIFSLSGGARFGFGLLKLLAIAGVAGAMLWNHGDEVLSASALSMPQLARALVDTLLGAAWWMGLSLLAVALLDYAFQRWRHERDLRMTYQEYRVEMKDLQGDPQVDARRRLLAQQERVERVGLRRAQPSGPHAETTSAFFSR